MRLRSSAKRGAVTRPSYRMPGAPVTNLVALGMLALVLCLMPFADTDQAFAFACVPVLAIVLRYGWHRIQRNRIQRNRNTAKGPIS